MDLDKRNEYIELFEIYKELLTEKQTNYFCDYYLYDLSFTEIAENYEVSRNAVFDQLKKLIANLEKYEKALNIRKRKTKLIKLIESKNYTEEELLQIIEE